MSVNGKTLNIDNLFSNFVIRYERVMQQAGVGAMLHHFDVSVWITIVKKPSAKTPGEVLLVSKASKLKALFKINLR